MRASWFMPRKLLCCCRLALTIKALISRRAYNKICFPTKNGYMPNFQCSPMTIRGMNRSPTYTARGTLLCTLGLDETIFLFLSVSLDNDDAGQIQQGRTYCSNSRRMTKPNSHLDIPVSNSRR